MLTNNSLEEDFFLLQLILLFAVQMRSTFYQSNLGEAVSLAVLSFATIRIRVVHVCACPIEYVHGTTYVKLYVWFESLPLEMR